MPRKSSINEIYFETWKVENNDCISKKITSRIQKEYAITISNGVINFFLEKEEYSEPVEIKIHYKENIYHAVIKYSARPNGSAMIPYGFWMELGHDLIDNELFVSETLRKGVMTFQKTGYLDFNLFTNGAVPEEIDENHDKYGDLRQYERAAVIKARTQQGLFRSKLLNKYGKCSLCGMTHQSMLIASHIKPYAVSVGKEKTDVNNGLLLCPAHDALFDQFLISFDENGKIMISDRISEKDRKLLNIHDDMQIRMNSEMQKFMAYHRNKLLGKM